MPAYQQSYVLVIFVNCLLFSTIVPIITIFAALYFYIKYKVDKYKLVFRYYKKYESGGRIKNTVSRFMVFNMILYMVTMVSFYGYRFDHPFYFWFGGIFSLLWLIGYLMCLKYWNTTKIQNFLMKIRVNVHSRFQETGQRVNQNLQSLFYKSNKDKEQPMEENLLDKDAEDKNSVRGQSIEDLLAEGKTIGQLTEDQKRQLKEINEKVLELSYTDPFLQFDSALYER